MNGIVLVAAGTSWDGIWMPERHVVHHLSQRIPVLWVDPAISILTPVLNRSAGRALRRPGLRPAAPNVMRLSPIALPGVTRPVLREIAVHQTRRAVRRAVAQLGAHVRATLVAGLGDMLDVVPTDRRVFYGTDDLAAGGLLTGVDDGYLASAERRQLAKAETVIAISPYLAAKWAEHRPDVAMIANGCEPGHYAGVDAVPRPADVRLPPPIAGFVGHLSERIDLDMLSAVARTGVSVLLVGPCQPTFEMTRLDALLARPNVQWVGPKPFAELPGYLGCIDVGLTPYRQTAFNLSSFPLKTLEYLAAGRPAVVSDLPAHRWLDTTEIAIATGPEEFAARTRALLGRPRIPQQVAARRALAREHSWAARADAIADAIGLDDRHPALARVA